jgi:hypothetical protein
LATKGLDKELYGQSRNEPFTGSEEVDIELAEQSSNTPSDQKSREAKNAPYRDAHYSVLLATKGSFVDKDDLGIVQKSKLLVQELLDTEQPFPRTLYFGMTFSTSLAANSETGTKPELFATFHS